MEVAGEMRGEAPVKTLVVRFPKGTKSKRIFVVELEVLLLLPMPLPQELPRVLPLEVLFRLPRALPLLAPLLNPLSLLLVVLLSTCRRAAYMRRRIVTA